jgi:uncharacterized protein YbjT (DUF2867 family)
MKYLVTGATGKIGARVTKQLLELGVRPRVLVRNADKARTLFGDRVDVCVGDLSDIETVKGAFKGADTVFLVNVGPEIAQRDRTAAGLCRELHVTKIVKLSSLDADEGLALGAWHQEGEAAIRESGVPFVSVRPTGFMSNLLNWAHSVKNDGVVRSSTAEGHMPFIDPEDIASVSVKALTEDHYLGELLPLTGPQSLSYREATAMLAEVLKKPLRYEVISDEEAGARYARVSSSEEDTKAHVALWRAIRDERLSAKTDCVSRVLGRSPVYLRDWMLKNAHHFRD